MSLITQIQNLATRIATEFKTVRTTISGNNSGDISALLTTAKAHLVEAINEVKGAVDGKQDVLSFTPEDSANKGAANGYAPLDGSSLVPSANLPSYVDDVLEFADLVSFPATGESGKIYIDSATNKQYRWSGTDYAEISSSLALGTTSSTAYRGDHGLIAYNHSQVNSGNPHSVAFSELGSTPTTLAGYGITDAYTKTELGDVTTDFTITFETGLA